MNKLILFIQGGFQFFNDEINKDANEPGMGTSGSVSWNTPVIAYGSSLLIFPNSDSTTLILP